MDSRKQRKVVIHPDVFAALWSDAFEQDTRPYDLVDRILRAHYGLLPRGEKATKKEERGASSHIEIAEKIEEKREPVAHPSRKKPRMTRGGRPRLEDNPAALSRIKELMAQEPSPSEREIARQIDYPNSTVGANIKRMKKEGML